MNTIIDLLVKVAVFGGILFVGMLAFDRIHRAEARKAGRGKPEDSEPR